MRQVRTQNESGMPPRTRETPSCVTDPHWAGPGGLNMDHHGMVEAGIFRFLFEDEEYATGR